MAYVPTTFFDRSVEFANRRKFTAVPGLADTFDVERAEGTVFVEGTKLDAANLNAEFGKIKTETDTLSNSLSRLNDYKNYSDLTEKTITLINTSVDTTGNDIAVNEIINAKEVYIYESTLGILLKFEHIGSSVIFRDGYIFSLDVDHTFDVAFNVIVNFSTGIIKLITTSKGSNAEYPILSRIYYR